MDLQTPDDFVIKPNSIKMVDETQQFKRGDKIAQMILER